VVVRTWANVGLRRQVESGSCPLGRNDPVNHRSRGGTFRRSLAVWVGELLNSRIYLIRSRGPYRHRDYTRQPEPAQGGADSAVSADLDKELHADDEELTRTQKVRRATVASKYTE